MVGRQILGDDEELLDKVKKMFFGVGVLLFIVVIGMDYDILIFIIVVEDLKDMFKV